MKSKYCIHVHYKDASSVVAWAITEDVDCHLARVNWFTEGESATYLYMMVLDAEQLTALLLTIPVIAHVLIARNVFIPATCI